MSLAFFETKRKMLRMQDRLADLQASDQSSFQELFDIVWVYHDAALDGEVYAPEELRAALTDQVVTITESSSTNLMRDIRAQKAAIEFIRREAEKRTASPLLALTKSLHERLTPDASDRPGKYRRSGQLQRAYFHDIVDAGRISYLLRKTLTWAVSEDAEREHPIDVACRVHYDVIHVYPFEKNTGRVARLLLNYMLLRAGYAAAVIHAQDRQRYYESFRSPTPAALCSLVHESIENSIDSIERRLGGNRQSSGTGRRVALR